MPLVDSLERRLTASSSMLNQGSRLQLLTSVLTSLPIYFLCSLNIPAGIIKQLDRISGNAFGGVTLMFQNSRWLLGNLFAGQEIRVV